MKLSKRMRTYLKLQSVCWKASTINSYRTNLGHFHAFLRNLYKSEIIYKRHLSNLNKEQLQKYIIYLNKKKFCPYTKVNHLLSVRKYLEWEIEEGAINEDIIFILDRKKLPKVPEYLPRPLSNETDRILQNQWRNNNDPYSQMFLLLRLTGLRISELINLTKKCIVTNAKDEHFLKVPLGKMNNERFVPLTNEGFLLVQKIKNSKSVNRLKIDNKRLIGIKGTVLNVYMHLRRHFSKSIGNITDQNKTITFHRLRHTYATSLLTAGLSIVSIMKLLGHRRIEMSLRYAKVTPTHLRNEYLRAIAVIEKDWIPYHNSNNSENTAYISPADLISKLTTFVKKEAVLAPSQQNNLIKRLTRLKQTFQNIPFNQNFPCSF